MTALALPSIPAEVSPIAGTLSLVTAQPVRVEQVAEDNLYEAWRAGKSTATMRAYTTAIANFAGFLTDWFTTTTVGAKLAESLGVQSVRDLDEVAAALYRSGQPWATRILKDYIAHQEQRGLKPATINLRASAIRSLVNLGEELGYISWRVQVKNLKSEPYRDTAGPGLAGVIMMLMAIRKRRDKPKKHRDLAVIRVLHDMGLRRCELCSLDVEHVRLGDKPALKVQGKGRTERRWLTMPKATAEAVARWMEARETLEDRILQLNKGEAPLFVALNNRSVGSRIDGAGVAWLVAQAAKEAGIPRVKPHGLRHSAATTLLDMNVPIRDVQRFGRWKSADILLRFYDDNRKDLGGAAASKLAAAVRLQDNGNGETTPVSEEKAAELLADAIPSQF